MEATFMELTIKQTTENKEFFENLINSKKEKEPSDCFIYIVNK
jgi:hypothetical protein